ncbi:LPD1 domain-containing protein [Pseudomonas sp.]|uniref:LPD1 domain-containing protein n=1 Tax=Pseudomonas sp. TaxID=306 RepID=UPI002913F497|nr:LPD1 domain-containing protein [Pseudomonas sp.]MDU4254468.1 LPD1 domain-containing protein [Pseudomonas sp.]
MDELPSVWGRHSEALIEPMMIRGKLLTSIIDAPTEWDGRLASLGFQQTNSGWLKIGGLTPTEYGFLSPDIDLIGFRPDQVMEATESAPDAVPLDVRDTLLSMWQKQRAMVMVALSMEHSTNHTRSQAWSFVEAALDGAITPETETLFGLAFTKMNLAPGGLSPEAGRYAAELGWQKPAKKPALHKEVKLLFGKGESIEWMDADGILQAGRIAKRMTVQDVGCWVYQAPRWISGYSVSTPKWVERTRLHFADSGQDWLTERALEAVASPSEQPATGTGSVVLTVEPMAYTTQQLELLSQFTRYGDPFPPAQGVEQAFSAMREGKALSSDAAAYFTEANLQWLLALSAQLGEVSTQLYGRSPLKAVLTQGYFQVGDDLVPMPAVAIAIRLGGSYDRNRNSDIIRPVIHGDRIDLSTTASEVEALRYEAEKKVRETSSALSQLSGSAAAYVMLASDFHCASPMLWPKVSEFYEGQITVDDVLRLQSVLLRGSKDAIMRTHGRNLVDAFEAYLYSAPNEGAPLSEVVVSVKHVDDAVVDLEAVRARLATDDQLHADWINAVPTAQTQLYEAYARYSAKSGFAFLENVTTRQANDTINRALVASPDTAIENYLKLLDQLEPHGEVGTQDKISQLRKLASNYPLYQRLLAVPGKLRAMDGADLRGRVKAQIYMQEAKRIGQLTEAGVDRLIDQIADQLRSDESQGAAVLYSSTGRTIRWRVHPVPISVAALDQTRKGTMESAQLRLKTEYARMRGVTFSVDGVAICDPELAELLNGEGPAQLKATRSEPQEGYQDTGVVAGWAMKDIRGMHRSELLDAAGRMSDEQKALYITRELLWPRKSFEEMKEAGADLRTAFAYDLFWKAMPKAPLTSTREHVNGFIDVISSMRSVVEPLLGLPFLTPDHSPSFAREVKKVTQEAWNELLSVNTRRMYSRAVPVRGYRGLSWHIYSPSDSSKLMTELNKLSWSQVLKSKQSKPASAGGSRVARGELVRKGPDYRAGKSVTGEDFIRTFGFSGVEYGNWTNQTEREKHLNLAFDSMMDFVRVMGWEPMTLSLGGKLGLCIGSRGRGGSRSANAHFEPVNQAINLTRMRGDGALAHEYFHAVANHYGRLATGSPVDLVDTFGYVLQEEGEVPKVSKTGLRDEMQQAFHNLVVAIMRMPKDGADFHDISQYTQRSVMLESSMAADGASRDYFGSPCEMFARSMEVWFKDRLQEAGEQNDYLVRVDKAAGSNAVYPDIEHLGRINHFVSPWLDAIRQEVSRVDHPFLGNIEMPILNTELRSIMPMTPAALAKLAETELDRLFRACAPNLMLVDDPVYRAGLYDLSRDLVILNAQAADEGTFYHEAWHACHGKLLSCEERYGLSQVFDPSGPLADQVARLLVEQGASLDVVDHMRSDTMEVQAYAFQLWKEGRFTFDASELTQAGGFYRVGTFVEGVTGVGAMFGPAEAERLFARFVSGELAARQEEQQKLSDSLTSDIHADAWDGDNVLYWAGVEDQVRPAGKRALDGLR